MQAAGGRAAPMKRVARAQIIKACRAPGPLALSALSAEELELLEAMMRRLDRCAKAAFEARLPL